jgi:hypothetical protein
MAFTRWPKRAISRWLRDGFAGVADAAIWAKSVPIEARATIAFEPVYAT